MAKDDDKPHKCPQCDYRAKTKGAITQHMNKEHAENPLAKIRAGMPGTPAEGSSFQDNRPLVAVPSGVPAVDFAIGIGGAPAGTIMEVFGPSASGKTFMALTFSANAQANGKKAGYMDAERALQPTFTSLVPGLDADALEYDMPPGTFGIDPEPWDGTGEAALEAAKQFIRTGEMGVYTIDSVAACTPRQELQNAIGSSQANAALARLMRAGLRSIVPAAQQSGCLVVFVNHVTAIPQAKFGRDWSKPADEAFNYFASIQLHVTRGTQFFNKDGRRIGHTVKVKVHKSKVAAPHAKAEYDLFYAEDTVRPTPEQAKKGMKGRDVVPGIDIATGYLSVLQETGHVAKISGTQRYLHVASGEMLGEFDHVHALLDDPSSDLFQEARGIVYPEQYRG